MAMHEALSQKDIDVIVGGPQFEPGAGEAADAPAWDFTVPRRLSRGQRGALESVHTAFASALQAALGSRLRGEVELIVRSIERTPPADVLMSLDSPCVAFTFTPGGSIPGVAMIDLSASFAYHVVDRLFGGSGEGRAPARLLTSLEQTIARQVAVAALDALREAWSPVAPIAPEIVTLEQDPEVVRLAGGAQDVLAVLLEARSGTFRGGITLALPMPGVEAALALRDGARALPTVRRNSGAGADARVATGLRHARVEMTARLPVVHVPAREIVGFVPGQVFRTGLPRDTEVEVRVNGSMRFLATLGQLRRRLGLRITKSIDRPGANAQEHTIEGESQ